MNFGLSLNQLFTHLLYLRESKHDFEYFKDFWSDVLIIWVSLKQIKKHSLGGKIE